MQRDFINRLVRRGRRPKHSESAYRHAYWSGSAWDLDAFADEAAWAAVDTCSVMSEDLENVVETTNFVVVARDMQRRFPQAVRIKQFSHFGDGEIDLRLIALDAGDKAAVAAAADWGNRVEHYGVADATQLASVMAALADAGLDPNEDDDRQDVGEFLLSYFDDDGG